MSSVGESLGARTELGGDLAAGVEAISSNQTITFTKYVKLVLPIDGYVFWVRADLVSNSALLNAARLNAFYLNEPLTIVTDAATTEAKGSFHYATDNKQSAEASYAVNRVIFTSLVPINDLDAVGPNVLFIGEFEGVKFAFSSRKSFYRQAEVYHYVGDAVYPIMESQLVDKLEGFSARQIVSNSIPIWLSMNNYDAPVYEYFSNLSLILYPAFLANENVEPPFATVDVSPETTVAVAGTATLGPTLSHSQLVKERARINLWGLDNDSALTFVDFVNQFSLDTDLIGIMNMPVIRDERTTQVELGTLAQRKSIEFEISYYQNSARNVARQLILSAIPSFFIEEQQVA